MTRNVPESNNENYKSQQNVINKQMKLQEGECDFFFWGGRGIDQGMLYPRQDIVYRSIQYIQKYKA